MCCGTWKATRKWGSRSARCSCNEYTLGGGASDRTCDRGMREGWVNCARGCVNGGVGQMLVHAREVIVVGLSLG